VALERLAYIILVQKCNSSCPIGHSSLGQFVEADGADCNNILSRLLQVFGSTSVDSALLDYSSWYIPETQKTKDCIFDTKSRLLCHANAQLDLILSFQCRTPQRCILSDTGAEG
jgi:hypothetical protein